MGAGNVENVFPARKRDDDWIKTSFFFFFLLDIVGSASDAWDFYTHFVTIWG